MDLGLRGKIALITGTTSVSVISETSLGAKHPGVVTGTIHDNTGEARAYWHEDNDNPTLARFLKLVRERYPTDGSAD